MNWQHVQALFDEVLQQPLGERSAFLDRRCGGDAALFDEVASLVRAHETPGPFDRMAESLGAALAEVLPRDPGEGAGGQVGPYKLVREIGQGGMGTVYLAERADGAFEQRVALKVVRGISGSALRRRFLRERQILARLEHPHIARLLDGGMTAEGQPFFAMEMVEGVPIDGYCAARELDVDARLLLFLDVCEAVRYAHQNLIVHRDLKPSNILVTQDGQVKLLDFGIARLLESDGDDATQTGHHALTPRYASPEQLQGTPVTTVSDVYSLGVVLYELLTGKRPHDVSGLRPEAAARVVAERVPTLPSEAVRGNATQPPTLHRRLVGDLDTLVMKALAREPERRYPSAEALADDIRRHLAGFPIEARPDTLAYRTAKFARRHKGGLAVAALLVLVLVSFTTALALQQRRTAAERDRAQVEAAKARQVSDFLVGIFQTSDPSAARGDTVTARHLLDAAAERLSTDLVEQPEVQAEMQHTIGRVYATLGLHTAALPLVEEALATRRALLPPDHPGITESLELLGLLHYELSAYDRADSLLALVLERRRARGDAESDLAPARLMQATVQRLQGRNDEAEAGFRAVLTSLRAERDASDPGIREAQEQLAMVLHMRGDFVAAERLYQAAVAHGLRNPGGDHQAVLEDNTALGRLLYRFRNDYTGADTVFQRSLRLAREHFGEHHPNTATVYNDLAQLYRDWGRPGEAESFSRQSLGIWQEHYPDDHREVAISKQTLATILWRQRRYDEAVVLLADVEATFETLFESDHPTVINARQMLGAVLRDAGRYDEADAQYQRAEKDARARFGDVHAYVARSLLGRAQVARARGDRTTAEALLREAVATRHTLHPEGHWRLAAAQSALADVLIDGQKYAEAEVLLLEALPVLENERSAEADEGNPATVRAQLARLYEVMGHSQQAAGYRR